MNTDGENWSSDVPDFYDSSEATLTRLVKNRHCLSIDIKNVFRRQENANKMSKQGNANKMGKTNRLGDSSWNKNRGGGGGKAFHFRMWVPAGGGPQNPIKFL